MEEHGTWDEMDYDERIAAVESAISNRESSVALARRLGAPPTTIQVFASRNSMRFLTAINMDAKLSIAPPEELGPCDDVCTFPVRNPSREDPGFCGAPTERRKPYCKTHIDELKGKRKDDASSAPA